MGALILSTGTFLRHVLLFEVVLMFQVLEQQSCLHREHLERYQLENRGGALPWIPGGYLQDSQSFDVTRLVLRT